jgi:ribosomal protein S18 acetylase RimI-like enzyme
MSVHVRRARSEDQEQLVMVKPYWGDELTTAEYVVLRLEQMQASELVYLIAQSDRDIIGQVILKFTGNLATQECAEIVDLYIKPEFRRQGAATALLQQCEEVAAERGYAALALAAGVDENGPERHLYRKLGYEVVNNEPYVDGVYNGEKDWVIDLKKTLGAIG